ncbi:N-acetyltransferase [Pseudomonas aeruginosa]|uniref:N-acetyltransferase n=1 Tax=Pseudomonas aeruginosa TaxID=287 RepID=A0A367M7W2_PSEAI|nr:N-acetyltransferase [Pseudomonas aeruginosa]
MNLTLRPAGTDDLSALVELENRCFDYDRLSRRNFQWMLTRAHASLTVAEGDGGVLGYALVLFHEGTSLARLYSIAIDPRARGIGLGQKLLEAAEQAARTVYLTNAYASVALGYGKSQPLLFSVTADGNFTFELPKLTLANAADFYANAPRTSLVIENLNIGGTRPGYGQVPTGGYNMGRNEISGLSFNYLKVTSHNL